MYTLAMLLYNLVLPFFFVLYFPFYLKRLKKRGNYKDGFGERFGLFKPEKKEALRALNSPIWIHSVSVGETVAALSFIKTWQAQSPDQQFVLSTTTSTGQLIARKKAPEGVVPIYCPMDFFWAVRSAFNLIQPKMFVIFEVEVWPNLIRTAARRGIPAALVNCRMSDKSAAGYSKHSWLFHKIFNSFDAICTQTEEDANRVLKVLPGSDKVTVCGTMKFDQVPDRDGGDITELLDSVFPKERLVFLAASTHAPEEALMANMFKALKMDHPELRMVLVPRHQEREPEVRTALEDAGLNFITLTELRESSESKQVDVLMVNTTGELMNFFAGSDIVFVGKSLRGIDDDGGHNIIEPAIFGKPILFGPEMHNFRDVVRIFLDDQSAIQVKDADDLKATIERLLTSPEERDKLSAMSRETVEKRRGAIPKTIEILERV